MTACLTGDPFEEGRAEVRFENIIVEPGSIGCWTMELFKEVPPILVLGKAVPIF